MEIVAAGGGGIATLYRTTIDEPMPLPAHIEQIKNKNQFPTAPLSSHKLADSPRLEETSHACPEPVEVACPARYRHNE
ncbi:MAG: hypothetical protein QOH47_3362 [Sphingomonadales bacterium]|jgi:hypothetical protein|nr:hypothetical protein [Sphingomonadales bacterium]